MIQKDLFEPRFEIRTKSNDFHKNKKGKLVVKE